MLVMAAPVLLALAGALCHRFRQSGPRAPAGVMLGYWSAAAVVMMVPNFLGCLFVTAQFGAQTDLLVLPEIWPQLAFFVAVLGLIGFAARMYRTPERGKRT